MPSFDPSTMPSPAGSSLSTEESGFISITPIFSLEASLVDFGLRTLSVSGLVISSSSFFFPTFERMIFPVTLPSLSTLERMMFPVVFSSLFVLGVGVQTSSFPSTTIHRKLPKLFFASFRACFVSISSGDVFEFSGPKLTFGGVHSVIPLWFSPCALISFASIGMVDLLRHDLVPLVTADGARDARATFFSDRLYKYCPTGVEMSLKREPPPSPSSQDAAVDFRSSFGVWTN
mmetsp:Transcript_2077/g.2956  ORF Transcript_2077/g.2956 Transcript_2077/m.2956 type:complete len:232 (-) Transcript_2077:646-1341(-)